MFFLFFFFKQKTAYEMRISDWSSDVCSSDLVAFTAGCLAAVAFLGVWVAITARRMPRRSDEKWQRDVSRNVAASWTAVAARVGLEIGRASCRERVCQYV